MWQPLLEYKRNGLTEVVIHGSLSWVSGKKEIYSWGTKGPFYGRSILKPIQAKVIAHELADSFTLEEKALSISSHNGESYHLDIFNKMNSKETLKLIRVPESFPFLNLERHIKKPKKIYHMCSGKHAAILKACDKNSWDKTNYTTKNHNFHKAYLEKLKTYLGEQHEPLYTATDGCGLPTVSFTMKELAKIFSCLVQEKDNDWIWKAMTTHPKLIGGFNRLDTNILASCAGKVLAKEGADGLLGLAIYHPNYAEGLGIIIKIAHGWDSKAMWHIAYKILKALGFTITPAPFPEGQEAFVNEKVLPNDL